MNKPGRLTDDELLQVIQNRPLVSIDLILRDPKHHILLGLRKDRPAQGVWFVPGGAIKKTEKIEKAMKRLLDEELHVKADFQAIRFVGYYDHYYEDDNFLNRPNVDTQYVVLAIEVPVVDRPDLNQLPTTWHSDWRWFSPTEALAASTVHENTRRYFQDLGSLDLRQEPDVTRMQYEILNARRDALNDSVWNSPMLSLTAQAFLLTIVLGADTDLEERAIAAALGAITAIASIQLMARHRHNEETQAKLLHAIERRNGWSEINCRWNTALGIKRPGDWLRDASSYRFWRVVLWAFFLTNTYLAIWALHHL